MIPFKFLWPFKSGKPVLPQGAAVPPEDQKVIAAFNAGYLLAMEQGLPQLLSVLQSKAIEEALQRLDSVIEARAKALGTAHPRTILELQQKQQEFSAKLLQATMPSDQEKYRNYLTALEWALYANGLPTHQV